MKQNIAKNITDIRARIINAEQLAGRKNHSVKLIAVSKTKPVELIHQAYLAGQTLFGESYLQEALAKIDDLKNDKIEWHFIGPIQSNKTKPIAESFSWVHSVDRLKIAKRLNEQRPEILPKLNICLQVNISGEESKSGIKPEEVSDILSACLNLPRINVRGLMAIPAISSDVELQRKYFKEIRRLLEHSNQQFKINLDTLSMGMSSDLEAAILEGATHVRIGTAIFGKREPI